MLMCPSGSGRPTIRCSGTLGFGEADSAKRERAINELAAPKAQRLPAALWRRGISTSSHQVPV